MALTNKSLDEEIVILLERRYFKQENARIDAIALALQFPQASMSVIASQIGIGETLFAEIYKHLTEHRWKVFLPGGYETDIFRDYHAQLEKDYILMDRKAIDWLLRRLHYWLVDR